MSGEVTAGADRGAVNETTVNFKGRESSVHFNPTAQSPRIAGPVFDQYFPAAWTWVRASFIKGVRVTLCRCVGNLRRWETLNRPPHEFLNLQTRRRDIGRTHRNVKPGGGGRVTLRCRPRMWRRVRVLALSVHVQPIVPPRAASGNGEEGGEVLREALRGPPGVDLKPPPLAFHVRGDAKPAPFGNMKQGPLSEQSPPAPNQGASILRMAT